MAIKILVMGLSGTGKSTFAKALQEYMQSNDYIVDWYNADEVRQTYNDWDFSEDGRRRQAVRMMNLSNSTVADYVICDFIAPTVEARYLFNADWIIWMDTKESSTYADTDSIFIPPSIYDFRLTEWNNDYWVKHIGDSIINNRRNPKFDWKKPTVQMLGRWQPWHKGHRALFERAIKKTGQVVIMIRDCKGWNDSNPFDVHTVRNKIKHDLDMLYQGKYEVIIVPNITNITYGRDVGYTIEEEKFDESITSISATEIRKEMGLQ